LSVAADGVAGQTEFAQGGIVSATEVIEAIEHDEPPAMLSPAEAENVATARWAGFIERLAPIVVTTAREQLAQEDEESSGYLLHPEADLAHRLLNCSALDFDQQGTATVQTQLLRLQFNRMSPEIYNALRHGKPLQTCRQDLEQAGLPFEFPDRMVFVEPKDHAAARQVPKSSAVNPSRFHLVCSASIEYLVAESLTGIKAKGSWARIREPIPMDSDSARATMDGTETRSLGELLFYEDLDIVRTMFHFELHGERSVVTKSTTQAHGSGANPRGRYSMLPLE